VSLLAKDVEHDSLIEPLPLSSVLPCGLTVWCRVAFQASRKEVSGESLPEVIEDGWILQVEARFFCKLFKLDDIAIHPPLGVHGEGLEFVLGLLGGSNVSKIKQEPGSECFPEVVHLLLPLSDLLEPLHVLACPAIDCQSAY
jgi:hypothetical protein